LALRAGAGLAAEEAHLGGAPRDGDDAGVDRALEGPAPPRLQLRRPDDDVRVHAGGRDRGRPPRRLRGARERRAGAARVRETPLRLAPRPATRLPHGADPAALATAGVEEVAPVRLQPAHRRPRGHRQAGQHLTRPGVDPADVGVAAFPRPVPELAVVPGDAGDEAVRLDRAQDRARFGIDPVDLPVEVLPHPQRPLAPGQPRVAPAAGGGDRRQDLARRRVDLVDAVTRDLEEVPAVEGRPGVTDDVQGAHDPAARRLEGLQLLAAREPDEAAVEAHAAHVRCAGEGPVLADDLGGLIPVAVLAHRLLLSLPYPDPPEIGSNKAVANPVTGAESQRRDRPRPSARTWPALPRATRARCIVRWLDPRASASAEVD